MAVRLDWPPDVVDRLREEARQKGLSLDDYVLQTVLQKSPNGNVGSDEMAKRQAREEAAGASANFVRATFWALT